MYELKPFTPIGKTNFRDHRHVFGIKPADRLYGTYCLGLTGMGKSKLIINMATDDMYKGNSVCVLDPHADSVIEIKNAVPADRSGDLIYFDATDRAAPPAFNPLHGIPEHQRQQIASELVLVFQKMFYDSWGSKLEHILRVAILSLLSYPTATLLDINALLTNKEFRAEVLKHSQDPYILAFWEQEYNLYSASTQAAVILPILNKIGVLLSNDILRGIFGQQGGISLDECMNTGKILLVNLSKGDLGEDVCTLLGSFFITAIQAAAMRRASLPMHMRRGFYLFVDEAHSFVSRSFATMVSQLRKFGVGIFLANQFLDQFDAETKKAILGSVGSLIVFKIGVADAKVMEREFYPVFTYDDFTSLPKYHVYVKLMIDGTASRGFSAVTLPVARN